jgi:hypothetical protein
MSRGSARTVMAIGALGRLSYAAGLLLAPEAMAARRLAPASEGNAYAGMTTRAFGAVHVNLALLTLRAALLDRDARTALGLNIGCDIGDLLATLLEWRQGGALDSGLVAGSAALQSAATATWITALRNL